MTSFANLINRCEVNVNDEDNSTWGAEQLIKWLNDGIRDYSQYFPRVKTQTISCGAGDNEYDLNTDFIGVLSVEYPTGEDPPDYLSRLPHTHADFWSGTKWYDIIPRSDDTDPNEIWISAEALATESIDVIYHGHHELITDAADANDDVTVPPVHQPILVKFVMWQASNHLLFAEQQSPTSNSSLLMAQLSQNARRMENSYQTALRQAMFAADGESRPVVWTGTGNYSKNDTHSRIY